MNRRDLIGASLAAVGGVFMGRRWYQQGRGLVVPESGIYHLAMSSPGYHPTHLRCVGSIRDNRWHVSMQVSHDNGYTWREAPHIPVRVNEPVGSAGLYSVSITPETLRV